MGTVHHLPAAAQLEEALADYDAYWTDAGAVLEANWQAWSELIDHLEHLEILARRQGHAGAEVMVELRAVIDELRAARGRADEVLAQELGR